MVSITKFLNACKTGNIDVIRQYIAEGGNIEAKDDYRLTGLIYTAKYRRIDCLRALIKAGADIDNKDMLGYTALIMAAKYGEGTTDCLQELITAGADVNACNRFGQTALIMALINKNYEAAGLLIDAGAYIYFKDKRGNAAIDYCNDIPVKIELTRRSMKHIKAAVKSADKPVIIKGFDAEL